MKKNKKLSQLNDAPLTQPQNRTERFLAKIARLADTAPADTRTRLERYLAAIVQSTATAGTISTDTETTVEGILFGNSTTGKVEGVVPEMSAQNVADYLNMVADASEAGGLVDSSQLNKLFVPVDVGPASLITLEDGVDGAILGKCVVNIEPVQSGSGDPSPTNVRPISGWTGAKVARTRKNLYGGTAWRDEVLAEYPDAVVDEENQSITATGRAKGGPYFTSFKPGTRYTFFARFTTSDVVNHSNICFGYSDGTFTDMRTDYSTDHYLVFTTPEGKDVVSLTSIFGINTGFTWYYEQFGLFEGVLTDTDFEPYVGNTYTISFGEAGTVYGGTLDVGTGVLTVTHAKKIVDASESVTRYSTWGDTSYVYAVGFILGGLVTSDVVGVIGVSDEYKWYPYDTTYGALPSFYSIRNNDNHPNAFCLLPNARILIKDSRFDNDSDGLKAYLEENPLNIVYPLNTPITYQLTPVQVRTLLGLNNLYADCGDVTVQYRGDIPNLYRLIN